MTVYNSEGFLHDATIFFGLNWDAGFTQRPLREQS